MILRAVFLSLFWIGLLHPVLASESIQLPLTIAATGKLLVDVQVNGHPVTCILDTGSPFFLLLDQQIADKQNLPKQSAHFKLRFFAEDEGATSDRVALSHVQIGPLSYSDVEGLTISDIKRATGNGYMNLPNFWAPGILGMAFLEHFRVILDYPHSTLTLFPLSTQIKPALAASLEPTLPVGSTQKSLPFLLDTGSTFSMVSEKAMDSLGFRFLSIGGQGGDRLYRGTATADAVDIGPIQFKEPVFEVAANFEEYAGRNAISGIIGYDNLKSLVLDFDFPHRTLEIRKP